MYRYLLTLMLAAAVIGTGCRPDACTPAIDLAETVSTALDEDRLDAAATALLELETLLSDEGGYLGGFRDRSRGLRETIEGRHDGDFDAAERRLGPLKEGWHLEAKVMRQRCGSYLF